MTKFTVHYEEGGHYSARATLQIEAESQEEAIQKVKEMSSIEGLIYDYEPQDNDAY